MKEEQAMNLWKPIAIVSIVGLATTIGMQSASAGGGACHDQPNMAAALVSLKAARASLDKAEHNKDGWRVAAIAATDTAIKETERGCAAAK
jgi:hypothetical protein